MFRYDSRLRGWVLAECYTMHTPPPLSLALSLLSPSLSLSLSRSHSLSVFLSVPPPAGDVINLGDRQLSVLHMPGHSRGSICLHDRDNKLLFSGDVVYDGAMIDWLPYSRVSDYVGSCERLVGRVDSERVDQVLPGP